jgi:hypothetical protein
MGTDADTRLRWDQDVLGECSPDDQIWGYSIRATEVLLHDRAKIGDEVLHKMLHQGLLDQTAGGPAWTEALSIKQGVRLVSSMIVRVLQKCFKMDDKVGHS